MRPAQRTVRRVRVGIRVLMVCAIALHGAASGSAQVPRKVGERPGLEQQTRSVVRPIEIWLNGRPFARGHAHRRSAEAPGAVGVDESCITFRDVVRAVGGPAFVRRSGARLDAVRVGGAPGAPLRVARLGRISENVHRMETSPGDVRDAAVDYEAEYMPLADFVAALRARVEVPRPGVFDLVIEPEDRRRIVDPEDRTRLTRRPILVLNMR